jgi:hypothetical protein
VAFGATDLLAGPIVRRVATDRVSIWVALGAPVAKVTLTVYSHTTVATNIIKGTADFAPVQIGAGLFIALPTVTLAEGARLDPTRSTNTTSTSTART